MIPRCTTYYNFLHFIIPQKYKSAANLYGYPLYVESSTPDQSRPIAWGKIKIMQKYLKIAKEQGTLDWIVWVDCDSFFMNMKLSGVKTTRIGY